MRREGGVKRKEEGKEEIGMGGWVGGFGVLLLIY